MDLDYYAMLGLDGCAKPSINEIKDAYRRLAQRNHPDAQAAADPLQRLDAKDANAKMVGLNEAYATLMDVDLRAEYDQQWKEKFGKRYPRREYAVRPPEPQDSAPPLAVDPNADLVLNEIRRFLLARTWIQVMDLAGVAALPQGKRFLKGWTAWLRADPKNPQNLRYQKFNERSVDYFKDLKYAKCHESWWSGVDLFPVWNLYEEKLEEIFDGDDFAVLRKVGNSVQMNDPNKDYYVDETLASFDFAIMQDIDRNRGAYKRAWSSLRLLSSREPSKDADPISAFCDPELPLLTLQGPPGSGKTTFITRFVAALLKKGVHPGDIACITRTHVATEEILRKFHEAVSNKEVRKEDIQGGIDICDKSALLKAVTDWRERRLDICAGTVYVGTIHGNPGKARQFQRGWLIVDEASQIPLPDLLYGLRYAKPNAKLRLLGDHKQLAPTNSFIRGGIELPKEGLDGLLRYLRPSAEGESYLSALIGMLEGGCFENLGGIRTRDDLTSQNKLEALQLSLSGAVWAQSLFSLDRAQEDSSSAAGSVKEWREALQKLNKFKPETFRQEESLHALTKHVFSYPSEHSCRFDQAQTNYAEASEMLKDTGSESGMLGVLRWVTHKPMEWWEKASKWRWVKWIKEKLSHSRRDPEAQLSPEDRENWDKPVPPFVSRSDEELSALVLKNCSAIRSQGALHQLSMDAPAFTRALLPALRKRAIIISCNASAGDGGLSPEDIEAWLAVLLLGLWEEEPFRVQSGIGVVTPFRKQEKRIRRAYCDAFPKGKLAGRKDWLATPERFQGRDLSRVVLSLATVDDEPYLSKDNMFNLNKLNVATSRAGSQQVIVGHSDLFDEKAFERYKMKLEDMERDDPAAKVWVRGNAFEYRRCLMEYARALRKQEDGAIVALGLARVE